MLTACPGRLPLLPPVRRPVFLPVLSLRRLLRSRPSLQGSVPAPSVRPPLPEWRFLAASPVRGFPLRADVRPLPYGPDLCVFWLQSFCSVPFTRGGNGSSLLPQPSGLLPFSSYPPLPAACLPVSRPSRRQLLCLPLIGRAFFLYLRQAGTSFCPRPAAVYLFPLPVSGLPLMLITVPSSFPHSFPVLLFISLFLCFFISLFLFISLYFSLFLFFAFFIFYLYLSMLTLLRRSSLKTPPSRPRSSHPAPPALSRLPCG